MDSRTDVYAIGCMIFEMLTGRRPFQANSLEDYRHLHLYAAIPGLPERSVTPESQKVITRCLTKNRELRLSVNDLLLALSDIYRNQFGTESKPLPNAQVYSALDYVNRAGTLGSLGRNAETVADCQRALEIAPTLATAFASRGNVYFALKEYDKALEDYDRAVESGDDLAKFYSNRSVIYTDMHRYADAIAHCTRAIEIDSHYAKAYANRASAFDEMHGYDKALADCEKALGLQPNYAKVFVTRGNVYTSMGQFDQAVADYSHAIEFDPFGAGANRGLLFGKLKRYMKSIDDFTHAIGIDPTLWQAYYNRGVSYDG